MIKIISSNFISYWNPRPFWVIGAEFKTSNTLWMPHHKKEKVSLPLESFVRSQEMSRKRNFFHISKVNFKDCSTSIEFLKIALFPGFIFWQESPEEMSLITLSLEEYVKLSKAFEQVIHTVFQPIWKLSTLRYGVVVAAPTLIVVIS